jgi:transglutaminase-like putative cysteine protease
MRRAVGLWLECEAIAVTEAVLAVVPAVGFPVVSERLRVAVDGIELPFAELEDLHGTRLHTLERFGPGSLTVEYEAVIEGSAVPLPFVPIDVVRYLRPSRYCESDRLGGFARSEFFGLAGIDLVHAVSSWVGTRLRYVQGSSRPIDGAVATLLSREGVCRDFAHLVVAVLRACDVPARVASVYAPGLSPMDFHAVAEAVVDGRWVATDATCLAPRSTMVRIGTGRDAADIAFLSSTGNQLRLRELKVTASVDGLLPVDNVNDVVQLM